MTKILYFIHRVRDPDVATNKARAYRWIRWLKQAMPDVAVLAPWLPYVEALDDTLATDRSAAMRDGALMAGLSGISAGIVCGPVISGGCATDIANLRDYGVPTISLTDLGFEEPPPLWPELVGVMRGVVGHAKVLNPDNVVHLRFRGSEPVFDLVGAF